MNCYTYTQLNYYKIVQFCFLLYSSLNSIFIKIKFITTCSRTMFLNHSFYSQTAPIKRPETTDWYQLIPQEITRIAKRIPDKWQMVGLSTGYFKQYELMNIQCCVFYHDGVSKGMEMLCAYQKRKGTREALAEALKECGEVTLADKVLQRYFQFYAE